jgi:5,10-methenyltetrahydromethanopterin hydrogenase
MGVERMQQAGVLEFNDMVDRGQALPQNFNKFMADWSTKQDPRAFVYDLMTKEQQDKLKKTLPPAELNKIRNGMNLADRHGLLGDVHHNE